MVYSSVHWCIAQCSGIQCIAVQYSAVLCSAVQYSKVRCSTAQCSTVQCSKVQYSAVQYSAVQCCGWDERTVSMWSPRGPGHRGLPLKWTLLGQHRKGGCSDVLNYFRVIVCFSPSRPAPKRHCFTAELPFARFFLLLNLLLLVLL